MERVLNKIAEYESCMWSWDIKPSDRNPYGIANDEYLCIDQDKLTIWSNYKQYWEAHWNWDVTISADDYLNPIKVGDIVEIQDDSEYNWYCSEVLVHNKSDNNYRLDIDWSILWRHEDNLQVIKRATEPTEEFKVGDKVEIVLEETNKYSNFTRVNWYRLKVWETFIIEEIHNWWWLRPEKWECTWISKELCKLIHDTWLDSDEAYWHKYNIWQLLRTKDWDVWKVTKRFIDEDDDICYNIEWQSSCFTECYLRPQAEYLKENIDATLGTNTPVTDALHAENIQYATASMMQSTGDWTLTEENIKEMVTAMMAESFAKELDKQILNTNNKTMNNIEVANNNIANKEYFENKKNMKTLATVNANMKKQLDTLEAAMKDIDSKRAALNVVYTAMNSWYSNEDSEVIFECMEKYVDIKEFLREFMNNTVVSLWETKETKEKFNVSEYFNK